jgi:hypothetical protein
MDNASLCIHPDYVQRENPYHFDDRELRDEWQDGVYRYARDVAYKFGYTILDFGCGSGFKLMKYFSAFNTIGYELEPSLSFLKEKYPDRLWEFASTDGHFVGDLLICADVIEHIVDPLPLLEKIKRGPLNTMIFSTPSLEILSERGLSPRLGPPDNESHIREWTTLEFYSFMSVHFNVLDHQVVSCAQGTQLILAELKK